MDRKTSSEHREMIRTLHERVGRNIIRTQALESSLKALLPFIQHNEEHCLAGLNERRKKFIRKTLGELMKGFEASTKSSSEEFSVYLAQIVNDRNILVHHFHEIYGGTAAESITACREVIDRLDHQFNDVKALERIVSEILLEILRALRDITFANTEDYEDFAVLCQKFETALAKINATHCTKTLHDPA
jgi:hypothetical protein